MKVRVLDEITINKIAAGEVVENAASVAKELIENALDAGAGEIRVRIVGGGEQLIEVADDGYGMGRDDALLALERHATSKIEDVSNLMGLETMGFRGEALPSIAAVSKFSLVTSENGEGTRIESSGGKILCCKAAARLRGTTVRVEGLFYNVPVRRSFQKSDPKAVYRVVTLLALSHPEVRFILEERGQELICAAPSSWRERVDQLLGIEGLVLEMENGFGLIGKPPLSKPNRLGQYLFVNRRPVVSPAISAAVRQGYGTRLPERRHPVFALFLDLLEVDVNVHPQKREVRLRDEDQLQALISGSVSRALDQRTASPRVASAPSLDRPTFVNREWTPPVRQDSQELFERPLRLLGIFSHYALVDATSLPKAIQKELSLTNGFAVVNLRAALARLLFEESSGQKAQQMLLVPKTAHLTPEEGNLLERHLETLGSLGFSLRPLGRGSFVVDAVPTLVQVDEVEELLSNMIEQLRHNKPDLALSSVVSQRRRSFQEGEAIELLKRLFESSSPLESPQGQRTILPLSEKELARRFS